MSAAINDRQPQDDPKLSEDRIGQNRAEDWQKIKRRNKGVIPGLGVGRRHHTQVTHLVQQILRHEDGQDGIHPVIGEAFRRFVADDVGHARRHGTNLWRRRQVLVGHTGSFPPSAVYFPGKNSPGSFELPEAEKHADQSRGSRHSWFHARPVIRQPGGARKSNKRLATRSPARDRLCEEKIA